MENNVAAPKKKAIILNGSPRRGNSVTMNVTRAFVNGIAASVPLEAEYINVIDLKISPCRGCLSCWSRTEGRCIIDNDDIVEVKRKIEDADYVIESYPLYFFGMPGIMKVFTDRLLSMMSTYVGQRHDIEEKKSLHGIRNEKPGRKLVVISSCAQTITDVVFDSLLMQYDCICGKGNYTPILCPQLMTMVNSSEKPRLDRYLKKFEKAGSKFALEGELDEQTLKNLSLPPFSDSTYKTLLDIFWDKMKKGELHV
ncbi:MAG: flavodoxin family protein [Clostridiales bacterium]|nr:flavodoxin family protein [Clostridiales bacterium]